MRIRHAMLAGTAVTLLSVATVLMASTNASAHVPAQAPAAGDAVVSGTVVTTAAFGSVAGLLVGLLLVLAVAAVSFVLRTGVVRRTPAAVITIPEFVSRPIRVYAGAFAE